MRLREEEIARLGEEIYTRIRGEIEEEHEGEVVLIEVESGDYFVAPTLKEAYEKARRAHPGKLFYARRVGRKAYAILRHIRLILDMRAGLVELEFHRPISTAA